MFRAGVAQLEAPNKRHHADLSFMPGPGHHEAQSLEIRAQSFRLVPARASGCPQDETTFPRNVHSEVWMQAETLSLVTLSFKFHL